MIIECCGFAPCFETRSSEFNLAILASIKDNASVILQCLSSPASTTTLLVQYYILSRRIWRMRSAVPGTQQRDGMALLLKLEVRPIGQA
jgi:hypothetical protein